MLMRYLHGTTGESGSRLLAGFGSSYGPQPYCDTLHRSAGWGRMKDDDVSLMPLIPAFHSEAHQLTKPAKECNEVKHSTSWH